MPFLSACALRSAIPYPKIMLLEETVLYEDLRNYADRNAIVKSVHYTISLFNTDIDPGCASIDVSPGPGFRKPDPGSSHDSSYVCGNEHCVTYTDLQCGLWNHLDGFNGQGCHGHRSMVKVVTWYLISDSLPHFLSLLLLFSVLFFPSLLSFPSCLSYFRILS